MATRVRSRKRKKPAAATRDFGVLFATHLRASILLDEAVARAEASRVAGQLELALDQIQQAEALHAWLQRLERQMRNLKTRLPSEASALRMQAPSGSH
ncbi:MAG: hypothetical protein JOZ12_16375 [Sinobacteraceae bacterium]|nr:hypothetical protein [Nevskiaceae bacterium]